MSLTRETFKTVGNKHLFELLARKEKFSEYIDGEYSEHVQDAINEIKELFEAIENGDKEEINKEAVDVVFTVAQLINKLMKDGVELDFEQHKNKIFSRSPNLKQGEKISREVENRVWHITKKQNEG